MAWDIKIMVISIPLKAVSVIATRTDDTSGEKRTFTVPKAVIDTAEQKLAVMDEIWGLYQVELNREATTATFLGTLELQASTNLEARE